MKLNRIIPVLLPLLLASCKAPLAVGSVVANKNQSINAQLQEDPAMAAFIAPYKVTLEEKMSAPIASTTEPLTRQGANSSLGNLMADLTLFGAQDFAKSQGLGQIDAAIINIGGLRTDLSAGEITLGNIYEVMPFENELVLVSMDKKAMEELFEFYRANKGNNPVSGLLIETSADKLQRALVGGRPLEEGKKYVVATSDYLALGGDNMSFFQKGEIQLTGIKLRDLYIEKFREIKEIKAPTDQRLLYK